MGSRRDRRTIRAIDIQARSAGKTVEAYLADLTEQARLREEAVHGPPGAGAQPVPPGTSHGEPAAWPERQPAPASPAPPSLYVQLGSAGGILRVVRALYAEVVYDPLLMGYFQQLNRGRPVSSAEIQVGPLAREWQQLVHHLFALLADATGGPKRYTGRALHDVHAHVHDTHGRPITDEAFTRLLWRLDRALTNLDGLTPATCQAVLLAVGELRPFVVAAPSQPTSPYEPPADAWPPVRQPPAADLHDVSGWQRLNTPRPWVD